MRPWQKSAVLWSQTGGDPVLFHSFSSIWNFASSHSLSISCPSFQAQSTHTLPWNHPGLIASCWVPKALFTSLISLEGPVLFCSIICIRTRSFSQLLGGKICAPSSVLDPDVDYF